MTKKEVKIGSVYTAKVTNKLVQVRIDAENRQGGWDATNLTTNKKVHIKSPARLRGAAKKGKPKPTKAATKAGGDAAEKKQTASAKPKREKAKRAKGEKKPKRVSGLDAAARVLEESGQPMTTKEMVEAAESKGYWKSPGGKTPHATIFSAITREIATKGGDSRFRKTEARKVCPRLIRSVFPSSPPWVLPGVLFGHFRHSGVFGWRGGRNSRPRRRRLRRVAFLWRGGSLSPQGRAGRARSATWRPRGRGLPSLTAKMPILKR